MHKFLLLSLPLLFSIQAFAATGSKNALKPLQVQKTELASPDIPGSMVLDLGFMNLSNKDDAMGTSFWGSKSLGLYYMKPIPVNDKMTFNVSLGIGSEKYSFDNDITLGYGIDPNNLNSEITTIDTLGFSATKSKLATTYIDLPLEFRFGFGGNPSDGGFIAIGGMAGVLVDSHTKVKYEENGRKVIDKVKDDFGISNFRYGVSGRIGYRGFNFYYKYYFSKLFSNGEQPQGTTAEPNPWAMGISFNLF